jgi:hypothetical protein
VRPSARAGIHCHLCDGPQTVIVQSK